MQEKALQALAKMKAAAPPSPAKCFGAAAWKAVVAVAFGALYLRSQLSWNLWAAGFFLLYALYWVGKGIAELMKRRKDGITPSNPPSEG